jgi:hypothetical protein
LYGQPEGTFKINAKAPLVTLVDNFDPMKIAIPTGAGFGSFTLADVNGDGIPDFVFLDALADGSTVASVVLGDRRLNFNSDFQPKRLNVTLPSLTFGYQSRLLQVADVDGDGHLDLVIAEDLARVNGFRISVRRGNGDGTFAAAVDSTFILGSLHPDSSILGGLALGDVEGNGLIDAAPAIAAVLPGASNSVMVLHPNGDGSFGALDEFAVGSDPIALRLGDLDNNGTHT